MQNAYCVSYSRRFLLTFLCVCHNSVLFTNMIKRLFIIYKWLEGRYINSDLYFKFILATVILQVFMES